MTYSNRPPMDEFQAAIIAAVRHAFGEEYCQRLDESRRDFDRRWDAMSDGQRVRWILDLGPHPRKSPR
jgi:hypothetical protein